MKRILTSLAAAAAISSLSTPSFAQDRFATQGTFAFGIERAFGFYIGDRRFEDDTFEDRHNFSDFAFALAPGSGAERVGLVNPYQLPRVGFDYFVIDGLSLGGSIGFWSHDDEFETENKINGNVDTDADFERSGFLISPRVGYAVMFSDVFGIWPRGGFTYYNESFDRGPGDVDANEFALTLEFHLIISPIDHVGITIGPVLDFGITGEVDYPSPNVADDDFQTRSFGIAVAGMFGYL